MSSSSSDSDSFLITEVEGTVVSELDERDHIEDYQSKLKHQKEDRQQITHRHIKPPRPRQPKVPKKFQNKTRLQPTIRETGSTDSYDEFGGENGEEDSEIHSGALRDPSESSHSGQNSYTIEQLQQQGALGQSISSFQQQKDGYQSVNWNPPSDDTTRRQQRQITDEPADDGQETQVSEAQSYVSEEALHALHCAAEAAQNFDTEFAAIKNPTRENSTPLFHSKEVVTARDPLRQSGYYTEFTLTAVRLLTENGQFGETPSSTSESQQNSRHRFMERSIDGHYVVKYLQAGLIEATDHGGTAAADMIYETRILMNLTPQHPNIAPLFAVNSGGIDTFLETTSPKDGFFFITDLIVDTLQERLEMWRQGGKKPPGAGNANHSVGGSSNGGGSRTGIRRARFGERLHVAFDISAALVFLHDRKIVYHIRPDKVGFDARQGLIKLCNFSQARYEGMMDQSRSITKSDDMTTLRYTAPELLCKSPGTTSCDVYGFGIMLWELLSLRLPFEGFDRARHFDQVINNHKRPPMNKKWSTEIKALLIGSWDPHLRLSMRKFHESLENIILMLTEEQNQQQQQAARVENQNRAAGGPSNAERMSRRNSTGDAPGSQRMGRRMSGDVRGSQRQSRTSGNARGQSRDARGQSRDPRGQSRDPRGSERQRRSIDPALNKGENSEQPAPRTRARRRNSAGGKTRPENPAHLEEAAIPPMAADNNLYSYGAANPANTNLSNRSGHSRRPRRTSLGHVPASVKRQPLYKRKNEHIPPEPEQKETVKAEQHEIHFNASSDGLTGVTQPETSESSRGSNANHLGLHHYAMQKYGSNGPPQEQNPSAAANRSTMKSIKNKFAKVRGVLSGRGETDGDMEAPSRLAYQAPKVLEPTASSECMLDFVKPGTKPKRRASVG